MVPGKQEEELQVCHQRFDPRPKEGAGGVRRGNGLGLIWTTHVAHQVRGTGGPIQVRPVT